MKRLLFSLALSALLSCGLSDDPREEDKRHTYIRISDPAFREYCLREADLDGDGRLSHYEAERILVMDCSGAGIAALYEIGEFKNLKTLICRDNSITELDLRNCLRLERVDCSHNRLESLTMDNLRALAEVDCADNRLPLLTFRGNGSLTSLRAGRNALTSLDVSGCAATMTLLHAEECPLQVLYKRREQHIASFKIDNFDVVREL